MRVDDLDWTVWTPRWRATLLFVCRDGAVLLIRKKRGLGAGKINGPGGRIEPGETALAAAVREVEEELRITPLNPEERGRLRFQFLDGLSIEAHVFCAEDFTGIPTETDEAAPLWVARQAIPYDQMWADDRVWLPVFLSSRYFFGFFTFDGERMLDHRLEVFENVSDYTARTGGRSPAQA